MIWKYQKYINWKQKKNFKFFRKRFLNALPNALLISFQKHINIILVSLMAHAMP
jgi:hypothetical protein